MSTWYDELEEDLALWRRRDWLEDVVMRAGLAHVVSWTEADQMLEALTRNPWDLSDWITVDELLVGIEPAEDKPTKTEDSPRWPDRLLKDLPIAIANGVCTAEEAEPWLALARARAGEVQVYESPAGNAKLAELRKEFGLR